MLTAYLVDRARRDAETLLLCPQFGTLAGAARSAAFGGWPAAGFLSGARLCGGPLARPCMLGQHRGGSVATGCVVVVVVWGAVCSRGKRTVRGSSQQRCVALRAFRFDS